MKLIVCDKKKEQRQNVFNVNLKMCAETLNNVNSFNNVSSETYKHS